MNQDLSNHSPETRSNSSPFDDKIPSQSLTKRNEHPQHEYQDHPLPYPFPHERVQTLFSSSRYMGNDYSDEGQQLPYPSEPTLYIHSSKNPPTRGYVQSYEPYAHRHRYDSTPTHATGQQSIDSYSYTSPGEVHYSQQPYFQYNPTYSASSYYDPPTYRDRNAVSSHYLSTISYPGTGHHLSHGESYFLDESGDYNLQAIKESEINPNDVLCGRGGLTNTHIGNRSFRAIVKEYQEKYITAMKKEKPKVAEIVVKKILEMTPPGRFIKKDKPSGMWFDVGHTKAVEKTCQALREGASKIRSRMESTKTPTDHVETANMDPEVKQSSDEDKKRSWEYIPSKQLPAHQVQEELLHPPLQLQEGGGDDDYNFILPDQYGSGQLLSYDDIGERDIYQSPLRMSESWDMYQSPRRKRPKSDSNSPGLPLDGNFFLSPRSLQVDRRGVKRDDNDKRPQSRSV